MSMPQRLLQDLEQVVGEAGLVRDEQRLQSYLSDWRNAYRGKAAPVSYTHLTLPTIYSV